MSKKLTNQNHGKCLCKFSNLWPCTYTPNIEQVNECNCKPLFGSSVFRDTRPFVIKIIESNVLLNIIFKHENWTERARFKWVNEWCSRSVQDYHLVLEDHSTTYAFNSLKQGSATAWVSMSGRKISAATPQLYLCSIKWVWLCPNKTLFIKIGSFGGNCLTPGLNNCFAPQINASYKSYHFSVSVSILCARNGKKHFYVSYII